MKNIIAILSLLCLSGAQAGWKVYETGVEYPLNTAPAVGDYFPFWDAGTDTTQQISILTLDARFLARANHTGTQAWSTLTGTPTTLSGYGIADSLTAAIAASTYQPLDADLTTWAAVTPSANGQSLVGAANYAAMRGLLDLEAGTDFLSITATAAAYQPIEATLTDIADGTIAENLVNTTNPWADNEVADAITVTGSVAAGTVVATGFNGNLATTDDTVQEIAQKLDDLTAGAGAMATDTLWNVAGDLAYGTGSDTASRLGIGTAGQFLIVNPGATAPVWSSTLSPSSITVSGTLTTPSIVLGAVTLTADGTELNYVDGVTSAIQTQLNAKVTTGAAIDAFVIAISDETTAHTTGTAKVTFRAPYAFTITAVRGSLTTVSSSGTPTWDINEGGTTILSTKLTIDASEKTSTTAAAAAVISDTAIADDAEITIDIDTAGTGAAGGKITIIHTH